LKDEDYFKKSGTIDGKRKRGSGSQEDLLPEYYVNSGLFESILGVYY
jgi:hypothetical protein